MNETIEEKKKILNTYGAAVRKYHALKNQEKHLRMIINRPRAAVLSGMPSSNKHKDISDIMIKLDDTLRMVKAAENEMLNKCAAIEKIIVNIPDGVASDIVHMRYIELMKWDDIAEKTGYDKAHTHRILNKTLENLDMSQYPPHLKIEKMKNKPDRRPTFLYKIFPHRNFKT